MIKEGIRYEDPEGIWEVVSVNGDEAVVKQVQEGNMNYGKEFVIPTYEVDYYIGR